MAENTNKDMHIAVGGLTDSEGARAIAKKLFESYSKSNSSELKNEEVAPMMIDAYKSMQKGFNPSKADVDTYYRVLDRNCDGRVTLQDLEQLAIKYLVGDGTSNMAVFQSTSSQPSYEQTNTVSMYKNSQKQQQDKESLTQQKQQTITTTTTTTTVHKSMAMKTQNYSQVIEQKLDVARRLFKKFDTDNSGTITEEEVAPLLVATYKNMGIDYQPTEKDVDEWMEMTDADGDGQVTLQEYEQLILTSLQKAGIKIE